MNQPGNDPYREALADLLIADLHDSLSQLSAGLMELGIHPALAESAHIHARMIDTALELKRILRLNAA